MSRALASLGRFPQAHDAFNHAMALTPANIALHAELGDWKGRHHWPSGRSVNTADRRAVGRIDDSRTIAAVVHFKAATA
jgi:hypothetical protein